jgi:nicotinamide mononucleotide transporter
MSEILISFITYAESLPWLELVAMLLALAYVLLAASGSIWCWPAALISTAIYTYVFYDVLLLMDSALSIYYLIMAVYGYWAWQQRTPTKNEHSSTPLGIVSWQLSFHVKACLALTLIALALGYIMANYTPADFPYLDTFTTVFAVFATYLVAQKVLENWLYWIVIDAASIYLYVEKDLTPTAVLFILYTFIATWGYFKWRSLYSGNKIAIKHRVSS